MSSPITTQQAMRYNRQISLLGFDLDKQERLCQSSALIIGLGGLGCAASQYLATSGIAELTLVDDDEVDVTNLQRQVLHTDDDVGHLKVMSAQQALRSLRQEIKLNTIAERLDDEALRTLIQQHDIVLDCSDNLATRRQLNRLCYAASVPLVSGAAIRMEGQLFSVIPTKRTACYDCFSHLLGEQQLSCTEAGVMSPVVGIIGNFQALEAIKILTDFGDPVTNALMIFDAAKGEWQKLKLTPSPQCSTCQQSTEHA